MLRLGLLILLVPAVAAAQPAPATPATPAPAPAAPAATRASTLVLADPPMWGGIAIDVLPMGSIANHDHATGTSFTSDTTTTVGFTGLFDVRVWKFLSVGLWPSYITNVQAHNANDSASELDLRARVTAAFAAGRRVRLFAYGAAGFSWVFPPTEMGVSEPNDTGPCFTFGGGAAYGVSSRTALAADVGYQIGLQSTSTLDVHVSYLHIGIGLLVAVGH